MTRRRRRRQHDPDAILAALLAPAAQKPPRPLPVPAPGTLLWRPVTAENGQPAAEASALGTTVTVVVTAASGLPAATAAVGVEIEGLDRAASRFRADSALSGLHRADGRSVRLGYRFQEALETALWAARWTGGRVDPTVGGAMGALGYDRDFAEIARGSDRPAGPDEPAPGWEAIQLQGSLVRLPPKVRIDLGVTAKALGADRAAAVAARAGRCGAMVSVGGDIATSGAPPADGWLVVIDEDEPVEGLVPATGEAVVIEHGALATSSTTTKRWRRGTEELHHIVDPSTGRPVDGPWRTASVLARNCVVANAAATAALVAGDQAEDWIAATGLAARLVACDGTVRRLGGWREQVSLPAAGGGMADVGDTLLRVS